MIHSRLHQVHFIFFALFNLLILLPVMEQVFNFNKTTPFPYETEIIEKPARSIITGPFYVGKKFGEHYEKYYNRYFPLRDVIIKIKNQIDFSWLRWNKNLIVSKDGYLFWRDKIEHEEVELAKISNGDFNLFLDAIWTINEEYKKQGQTLIMVLIPSMQTVYPERLDDSTVRLPARADTKFAALRKYLSIHPEIQFIDIQKIFEDLRSTIQIYYKTDYHYTEEAGYYVARELVDRIHELTGEGACFRHPLRFTKKRGWTGCFEAYMRQFAVPQEDLVVIEPTWPACNPLIDTRKFDQLKHTASPNCRDHLLPPSRLIGDSYTKAWLDNGFHEYFKELVFFHIFGMRRISDFTHSDTVGNAEFVIFELLEGSMYDFMKNLLHNIKYPDVNVQK